jgi:hypothetical protein
MGPVVIQAPQLGDLSPRDARVVAEAQVSIVEPGGSHSSPEEDETGVEALVDAPSSMESPASEQACLGTRQKSGWLGTPPPVS